MNLIKYITIVDAFIATAILNSYFLCYFKQPQLFAMTVLFDNSIFAQTRSVWLLEVSINFLSLYAVFIMFLLNTCLAIDLILMLKYPFATKEKRTRLYLLFSLLIAAVPTLSWLLTAKKREESNTMFPDTWILIFALAIILAYMIIAIVSVFYAAKKLCRPGISKESQKLVLIRHVVSIIGFLIAQLYILTLFIFMLAKVFNKSYTYNSRYVKITKVLFVAQGFYLPLLRIFEPFFFAVVKKNVRTIFSIVFCCRRPANESDVIDQKSLDRHLFTDAELEEDAEQYQQWRRTRL